eukprot:CAMPEP_0184401742 /NCGR_PEP_ID=MMETSP0007-20130409/80155_1 /TAXON_ID=97485 /ORGANISM="Prymnesium parvum, Strain Texoma1" /LENGTH=67 /DNA_ID=CAMNT_0026757233 /DNA_START=302 /DNA_END=502 /DNA_ORIENTATION=-
MSAVMKKNLLHPHQKQLQVARALHLRAQELQEPLNIRHREGMRHKRHAVRRHLLPYRADQLGFVETE